MVGFSEHRLANPFAAAEFLPVLHHITLDARSSLKRLDAGLSKVAVGACVVNAKIQFEIRGQDAALDRAPEDFVSAKRLIGALSPERLRGLARDVREQSVRIALQEVLHRCRSANLARAIEGIAFGKGRGIEGARLAVAWA